MNYQLRLFLSLAIMFAMLAAASLCMSFVASCSDQRFPDVITTQPNLNP